MTLEVIDKAVIIVCAGLGDDVDDAARRASELGVVAVGLHLEFLDRIDRRIDDAAVDVGSRVRGAVEQKFLRPRSPAAHVEVGFEEVAAEFLAAAIAEVCAESYPGGEADQRQRVADIQRKPLDRSGIHHLANRGGGRLQNLGGGADLHLLARISDLQVTSSSTTSFTCSVIGPCSEVLKPVTDVETLYWAGGKASRR